MWFTSFNGRWPRTSSFSKLASISRRAGFGFDFLRIGRQREQGVLLALLQLLPRLGLGPDDASPNTSRCAAQHLLATRLEQLREQDAARTEASVPALWTDRLPELAARPLDGDATGVVIV
ncbi:hypothetical protein [Streptomyces sp. TE33382]